MYIPHICVDVKIKNKGEAILYTSPFVFLAPLYRFLWCLALIFLAKDGVFFFIGLLQHQIIASDMPAFVTITSLPQGTQISFAPFLIFAFFAIATSLSFKQL